MYKNIASILSSDNPEFRSAQNVVTFSRIISIYPSKSVYCLAAHRIISYLEKNINRVSLILDIMRDEGEDEEIINTIDQLHRDPTIKTKTEVNQLVRILADYIRWEKVLKLKESWLSSIDMIDDENAPIKETVDTMYKMATEIQSAYNIANVSEVSHTFDTCDKESMKMVVAAAKETGKVVTIEEHSVIGGLGSAVCDALSEKAPTKVLKIGVNDTFGESGPAKALLAKYGLDAKGIYEKVNTQSLRLFTDFFSA
jgi:hypothetical protein